MRRKEIIRSEGELKTKVEKYLRRDNRIQDSNITVNVTGTSVILEGVVRNYDAFRAAENDAYMVMGVKAVDNQLQIEQPESFQQPEDNEIEESVRSFLIWNTQVNSNDIDVVVDKGRVELNGSVYSFHELKLAEEIASNVNGVSEVKNNLIVNTRYDVNDELIADNVYDALDADPFVNTNDIEVSVDHGLVTISGNVQDYAAANAAHDALLYIPGVRGIVNNVTIG
ncbi:MAG: BON domain-containing protein [Bacteroidota bacterium]